MSFKKTSFDPAARSIGNRGRNRTLTDTPTSDAPSIFEASSEKEGASPRDCRPRGVPRLRESDRPMEGLRDTRGDA